MTGTRSFVFSLCLVFVLCVVSVSSVDLHLSTEQQSLLESQSGSFAQGPFERLESQVKAAAVLNAVLDHSLTVDEEQLTSIQAEDIGSNLVELAADSMTEDQQSEMMELAAAVGVKSEADAEHNKAWQAAAAKVQAGMLSKLTKKKKSIGKKLKAAGAKIKGKLKGALKAGAKALFGKLKGGKKKKGKKAKKGKKKKKTATPPPAVPAPAVPAPAAPVDPVAAAAAAAALPTVAPLASVATPAPVASPIPGYDANGTPEQKRAALLSMLATLPGGIPPQIAASMVNATIALNTIWNCTDARQGWACKKARDQWLSHNTKMIEHGLKNWKCQRGKGGNFCRQKRKEYRELLIEQGKVQNFGFFGQNNQIKTRRPRMKDLKFDEDEVNNAFNDIEDAFGYKEDQSTIVHEDGDADYEPDTQIDEISASLEGLEDEDDDVDASYGDELLPEDPEWEVPEDEEDNEEEEKQQRD